jgi:hypothetical protein
MRGKEEALGLEQVEQYIPALNTLQNREDFMWNKRRLIKHVQCMLRRSLAFLVGRAVD